jgi:hypothetical protein
MQKKSKLDDFLWRNRYWLFILSIPAGPVFLFVLGYGVKAIAYDLGIWVAWALLPFILVAMLSLALLADNQK